jgi:hypothetical protein
LVYWDTSKDVVTNIDTGAVVSGIGAATDTAPGAGNGFILGRALANHTKNPIVDGADKLICAKPGALRVQVVSVPGAPTEF